MSVTVPAVHRNLRGVLYPAGLWVLVRGGRWLCRGGQACARLVPYALPLPDDDATELLTRPLV